MAQRLNHHPSTQLAHEWIEAVLITFQTLASTFLVLLSIRSVSEQ